MSVSEIEQNMETLWHLLMPIIQLVLFEDKVKAEDYTAYTYLCIC